MPVITDIIRQKKNKNYYSIFIDNKYLFSLSLSDLNFLQLKINDSISEEKANKMAETFSLQKAKDYAYRLLSRKSYSEKAMKEKLESRFSIKISEKVIKNLKKQKYINDKTLLLEYAKNKIQLKPMGPFKLQQDLISKKFNIDQVKKTVEKIFQEFNEYELAKQVFEKRFKNIKKTKDIKVLNKVKNYLMSHGFNISIAIKIIEEIK